MKSIISLLQYAGLSAAALVLLPGTLSAQNKLPENAFPMIVTPHQQTVSATEQIVSCDVTTNVPFTISKGDADWITVTQEPSGKCYVHFAQNEKGESRTAKIIFSNKEKKVSSVLVLTQQAHQEFIPGQTLAIADMVQTIPMANVQKDPLWNIWCGCMIKGYDGKYHQFNSRWPKHRGHEAWISHSQIAYYVADKPEGPYHFVNIPLPQIDDPEVWDGSTTHNPYIMKHNGKYYLYYIATKGKLVPEKGSVSGGEWWKRRNSQRIGVAVADKPEGPWLRFDHPVLTTSEDDKAFDALCVTNPAVCVGRNGKIVMLYKAVCKNGTMAGGKVRFSVAFADSPTGPFKKTYKLIFQPKDPKANMVAEDPYIWYDKKTDMYYAIVRDVVDQFTGKDSGQLALLKSKDAIDWVSADKPKVLPRYLKWEDGTVYDAHGNHVERPFLYFDEDGIPAYLLGAISVNTHRFREHSFNARIPLKLPDSFE